MSSLDLRSINLGSMNVLTFETKKLAKRFPLPYLCYIKEAANRFWLFYVIARKLPDGSFSIMAKDGSFIAVEEKNWTGTVTYSG